MLELTGQKAFNVHLSKFHLILAVNTNADLGEKLAQISAQSRNQRLQLNQKF